MAIINTFKEFCDRRQITPYALSKESGLSFSTVYRLAKDPSELPTVYSLIKVCDRYQVQPSELIKWVNEHERP